METTPTHISRIILSGNRITIDVKGWQGFFDEEPRAGISFEPNRNASIKNVSIIGNCIDFKDIETSERSDFFSSGITIWTYRYPEVPIIGMKVSNNTIINTPGPGIYLNSRLENVEITGNSIINPGRSRYNFEDIYHSAILIDNEVSGVRIDDNIFSDSESNMKFGIVSLAKCLHNCSASRNRVQVNNNSQFIFFFQSSDPGNSSWVIDTLTGMQK